ncbi:unnamed protein product [Rotaria sp. Silwood1]|nr:unnamed protein product [Rotaria sp. Silwood1]CAF1667458.1 unnamed protein product [Rotaria sp. Silwood1]
MSKKSTRIKAGWISNITAKLAANLHIDEIARSGEDWTDDAIKIEGVINQAFKLKIYTTATSFTKRLLELEPTPDVTQ